MSLFPDPGNEDRENIIEDISISMRKECGMVHSNNVSIKGKSINGSHRNGEVTLQKQEHQSHALPPV